MRKIGGAAGANLSRKQIQQPQSADNKDITSSSNTTGRHGGGGGDKSKVRHLNRAGFEGKRNHFINNHNNNGKK